MGIEKDEDENLYENAVFHINNSNYKLSEMTNILKTLFK